MIEELKAEIERRKKAYDDIHEKKEMDDIESMYAVELSRELENLLSFIESLKKEQNVDLDDEIDNFLYPKGFIRKYDGVHTPGVCWRDWKGKKYVNRNVTPDDMRKYARHFYNLGLNAKAN